MTTLSLPPLTVPSPAAVDAAAERIRPYLRRTPSMLVEVDGRPVALKLEHLQLSGSFKLRGALNALLAGPRPDRVVTASGGNHGLGVATAAAALGVPATVVVPESAPAGKTRRIEAAGAELIRSGATFAEAVETAVALAASTGARFVPAYDDPDVVAGQGTLAREIVADHPAVDGIVVATGGGGLAAGVALGAGGRRVVAVEPDLCPTFASALAAGRPVDTPPGPSVAASALGATRLGDVPFAILTSHDVTSVLVDDAAILSAQARLWDEFRLAVEPAAALPLAALLAGLVPGDLPCLVICGANADWTPA